MWKVWVEIWKGRPGKKGDWLRTKGGSLLVYIRKSKADVVAAALGGKVYKA